MCELWRQFLLVSYNLPFFHNIIKIVIRFDFCVSTDVLISNNYYKWFKTKNNKNNKKNKTKNTKKCKNKKHKIATNKIVTRKLFNLFVTFSSKELDDECTISSSQVITKLSKTFFKQALMFNYLLIFWFVLQWQEHTLGYQIKLFLHIGYFNGVLKLHWQSSVFYFLFNSKFFHQIHICIHMKHI